MVSQDDLKKALALHQKGLIDLEGLCKLMAACGAQVERDPGISLDIAALATLFSSSPLSTQAGSAAEGNATRSFGGGRGSGGGDEDEGDAMQTIIETPAAARVRSSSAVSSKVVLDASQTALRRFCEAHDIQASVNLVLTSNAPDIGASGDARYALGAPLGSGGVGSVRWAVDRDLRRSVAIKRLHSLDDALQVRAFLEEAVVTGGLEHPGIVPIYELGYSEVLGGPYYAMKHLDGDPMSKLLRRLRMEDPAATGKFNLFKLLDIFTGVCQAIAYAHDHGVVHCDLKPANIVVGHYGEVTVVDWGLAKVLGSRGQGQARSMFWSGTPAYMAPEQARGRISELDRQTDIWALGAILYEILTMSVPFPGDSSDDTLVKLLSDDVELPSERAPERDIPGELERICMKALEKQKRDRFGSTHEMLRDLEAYLEGVQERRHREEKTRAAANKARKALSRLARAEATVDALQEAIINGLEDEDAERSLAGARDDLVFGYCDASTSLVDGLRADPHHGALQLAAGDLYWRCFKRLYPARVPAHPAARARGIEVLANLSQRALAVIVRTGVLAGLPPVVEGEHEDPWLSAVLGFCRGTDAAGPAPDGIAQVVERVAFLKAVSLFEHMAGHELLPIAEACEFIEFARGETIFSQGEAGSALFVIMEGEVNIVHDRVVLTTLAKRSCFGEIAVLDESTRTASVVCVNVVRCLKLTATRFREIVASNGEIGLSVMRVLTERLRVATDREASLRRTLSR